MKQHGMTREEYLKENFNEVNTLTARCLKNEIDAYVHEDYSELEVGKMYKVTHIGVFRSFTRITITIRGTGTLIHAKELYQLTCPS